MTLLYLDLNHWIGLSRARIGHRGCPAAYRDAYPILQRLTQAGVVLLPLSEVHYAEIRDRIRGFRQRNDLALVIAELSEYNALPPRNQVLAAQLRVSLAYHFGLAVEGSDRPQVGCGFGYAQRSRPLDGRLVGQSTPGTDPSAKLDEALREVESRVGSGWLYSNARWLRRLGLADRANRTFQRGGRVYDPTRPSSLGRG